MCEMRIGHGYDVHRMVQGRRLVIGGAEIPSGKGLLGHSDADVLTHAVMDAILGALGLPDIGRQFPDSDPEYAGISSLLLAGRVAGLMSGRGYGIVNVDCTVIAQSPKLSPYIDQMKRNLAAALGTDRERINIKATTEEGMGFTGSGEGIAAHAVCLLESKGETTS